MMSTCPLADAKWRGVHPLSSLKLTITNTANKYYKNYCTYRIRFKNKTNHNSTVIKQAQIVVKLNKKKTVFFTWLLLSFSHVTEWLLKLVIFISICNIKTITLCFLHSLFHFWELFQEFLYAVKVTTACCIMHCGTWEQMSIRGSLVFFLSTFLFFRSLQTCLKSVAHQTDFSEMCSR